MEVGPNIRAIDAADLTGEPGLDVGQTDVIGPSVAADRRPRAELGHEAANADILAGGGGRHGRIEAPDLGKRRG